MSLIAERFDNPIIASINEYHGQIASAPRYATSAQPPLSLAQENLVNTAIGKIVKLSLQYWENTLIDIETDPSKLRTIRNEVNVIYNAINLIKSLECPCYDKSPLKWTPKVEANLELAIKKLCLIEADQIRNNANATEESHQWANWVYKTYKSGSKNS